ncbi:MAG: carboxypeptidase-like regulatory domain-containing protein [Oceanipulchritudo sp.]
MKHPLLVLIMGAASLLPGQSPVPFPDVIRKDVRFTVLDSDGLPVEDARVAAADGTHGLTDADGRVTLNIPANRTFFLEARKDGFYSTAGNLWTGGLHRGPDGTLIQRKTPDSFTLELKEIRDPVYMRFKRFRGHAPATDKPVGWDFEAGDWVIPHGNGTSADVFFHFHGISIEENAFEGHMSLSFPGKKDGIQSFKAARPHSMEFGSDLAPPHKAPLKGYEPGLSHSKIHRPGEPFQSYREDQRNYLFRVRTKQDPLGQLLQACYGWFAGEIEFDPRGSPGPQLAFEYFFNPNPDPEARSLELRKP